MFDAQASQSASALSASAPIDTSSANLSPFLNTFPDALVIINPAGRIVLVNGQTEAIFGYARDELIGQPLELPLPQRFRAAHAAYRDRYFSTPHPRPMGVGLNLVGRRKDGSEFPVEISLNPLLLDGSLHALGAVRDMTPQRAAARERIQYVQQVRLQVDLLNLSRDAIFVRDPASRVTFWNTGAAGLYGWTAQEALGRISHVLLKTRFPIDLASIEAQVERGGQWEDEFVQTCRDGRVVTVESRWAGVSDEQGQLGAIMEINRDITRRRTLEQAAQTAYSDTATRLSFLQQVLDALPSGISLVHGSDARLLLANRAAMSVWGAEWQVGQPLLEFLATNGIEILDAQGYPLPVERYATWRAVGQGETVLQQQETIRRPAGSSLPVLASALPLSRQPGTGLLAPTGEPVALVVHQDVTTLKEAEYLKDEFVGIVAHELRTPLAALKGFADMLLVQTARQRGPALAEWQREALEEIGVAVTRLVDLSEELLDVTRLHLQRTPTNVVSLARRVAALLQQTTARHQVEVRTARAQLVADIDPGRIDQVLTNLVGNAVKYSPQGGPVIITLWEEGAGQAVGVSVADRGIGIPSSQQAQVFGRFMRADNTVAWGINGTGLGLYICRELVQRHGGQLWFESQEGTGSTFFLTLPGTIGQESGPVPDNTSVDEHPA